MTFNYQINRSDGQYRWPRVLLFVWNTTSLRLHSVLTVSLSLGILGCDQSTNQQMTQTEKMKQLQQPEPPNDSTGPTVAQLRQQEPPTDYARLTAKQVPKPEPTTDYASLVGVTDPSAPNKLLLKWRMADGVPDSDLVRIDRNTINELQSTAVTFDCTPYIIDETLRRALKEAPELKWLKVGHRATPDDLRWIGKLRNVRGLSLRWAELREADFQLVRELKDLRWLDLWGVELPPPDVSWLPNLPQLEVLFLSASDVTDDHLPEVDQFPELKVFGAQRSAIRDSGLRKLVRANPELRFLDLFECKGITRESASELAKLKDLKYLHVGLTPLADQLYDREYDGLPDLQMRLPKCFIGLGD